MMKDQTSPPRNRADLPWLPLALVSLPIGALLFLSLAARVYGFWFLSRWPRLFLFGLGAAAGGLLVGLTLRGAWQRLAAPRVGRLLWLGTALAVGILVKALVVTQPPAMPISYVLDISTPAAAETSGPVVFIELRDDTGQPVLPVDIRMEGDWQRSKEGWMAQADQPARLHYSFYAPQKGMLQVPFGEQPGGGQVLVELNGQRQQIDLHSNAPGQRLVDVPFQKQSRWEAPVFAADLVSIGLVLPLVLFVAPYAALGGARRGEPWLRSVAHWLAARLDYQKVFITAFIGLCLLPFLDFQGNITTINSFFGSDNRFWNAYTRIRQGIFGDRFIGGALVGQDGWLMQANDFNLEDYQNTIPFTDEELFQIQQRVDGTARYLRGKGITFLVVIPPNKNTIYADQFPGQIEVIGGQSRLDQLIAYQREHGEVQILDLRPALREARKERLVYHRTDTHWNAYGAYTAYVEILRELQKNFPNLRPHALDAFRYVPDGEKIGDIGYRWVQGAPVEPFFSLAPTFNRQVYKFDSYEDRVIYSHQYNQIDSDLPTAVIFHDSFMDWLAPFLSDHLQKAVYARALDMDRGMDGDLIEAEKPDIVIFECNERWIDRLLYLPKYANQGE